MKKFDEAEWQRTLSEKRREFEIQGQEAIKTIERLGRSVDAAKLFATVTAVMAIGPVSTYKESEYGSVPAQLEMLAYYLYPFFGVSTDEELPPSLIFECIDAIDKLLNSVLKSISDHRNTDPVNRIMEGLQIQAAVIRGSAYAEQTADEIVSIQGEFEDWFTKKLGLGPKKAQTILWRIREIQNKVITASMPTVLNRAKALVLEWEKAKATQLGRRSEEERRLIDLFETAQNAWFFGRVEALAEVASTIVAVGAEDVRSVLPDITDGEWNGLIELIGVTPASRRAMLKSIEVRHKPLVALPDNRVIMVDITNALDALWEGFEKAAKSDTKFYDARYQPKKAKWLEEKVGGHLEGIFPAKHIYRDLSYPDPDKGPGATAELDGAVEWGPFLILIEDKAKQFRMESQLGDMGRLRTDIKNNVEDAFEQARRAVRYIESSNSPEFTEISTGRKLKIRKSRLRRTYLLTVSQHQLAGLATRLASLRDLRLFKDGEYPFSISVADLEIISKFCGGPDVLLHYIERRLAIQKEPVEFIADELDFFGAYLDTRLQASRLWRREGEEEYTAMMLSQFSEPFDSWNLYERGELREQPVIELDIPDEIREILAELRNRNDDKARWTAFAILDLPDEILMAIAQMLRDRRNRKTVAGPVGSAVHQVSDIVVTVTISDSPLPALRQLTEQRAKVEKYRLRALKAIGIGVDMSSSRPFEFATWIEGTWQHDEDMEESIRNEPAKTLPPGYKLPGRNEKCICGSGKKFKKCCEYKYRA